MTDDARDATQAEKGVWCVGFVRENAAPESTTISVCTEGRNIFLFQIILLIFVFSESAGSFYHVVNTHHDLYCSCVIYSFIARACCIQVHIFGNLNDHPIRTSDGEEINGPNVFGYNIDIPRFPARANTDATSAAASPTRLPIRAIRYIGVNGDGSVCRFGARQSAVASLTEEVVFESSTDALIPSKDSSAAATAGEKKRSALEVGEPVALAPAPLWSQTLSLVLLLAMMCGIIIFMALEFSDMMQAYAEIYAVAVAGKTQILCVFVSLLFVVSLFPKSPNCFKPQRASF